MMLCAIIGQLASEGVTFHSPAKEPDSNPGSMWYSHRTQDTAERELVRILIFEIQNL